MTVEHTVRTYSSKEELPREEQLAHKLASVATDPVAVEPEVVDMVINRIIDNASVAAASLLLASLVAVPLSVLALRRPRLEAMLLGFANGLQVVPSIALLGLLM